MFSIKEFKFKNKKIPIDYHKISINILKSSSPFKTFIKKKKAKKVIVQNCLLQNSAVSKIKYDIFLVSYVIRPLMKFLYSNSVIGPTPNLPTLRKGWFTVKVGPHVPILSSIYVSLGIYSFPSPRLLFQPSLKSAVCSTA